ncbi:hypothetical protein KL944_002450 [Ogataea haglerorum]|nr:hypothetical protein KL944_002450 [Ogataea haglerorum]
MQLKSILSLAGLLSTTLALPTIDVVSNKFFYSNNGSQFYVKGVAYQKNTENATDDATYVDPLADEDACKRDIPYLQNLGINVIRVYAVDASKDHDGCMSLLEDAGIYVISDLSTPNESIQTTSPSWTVDLYNRYATVIDMFQSYDNVLGFFAGNEVITNKTNTDAAPFVKAAIRDMKQYMKDNNYRDIPIGYSANDDAGTRVPSADFFSCGDDDVKADFYGINMYEWCGNATFSSSGYEARTKEFSNLTIPIFFSEYGCNNVRPREFTEVQAIYSDEMTDVWSGGIVYMYFQEENDYGLVSIKDNTVSTLADYTNLKSELENIDPTTASASAASQSATELSCPTSQSNWKAATDLPPTPNEAVCDCLDSSLKCVVADDVDSDDYGDLFGIVCDLTDCSEISTSGSNGTYGAYSYCSAKDKLSFLLNKYYEEQDSNSSACDFSGSASLNTKASTASSCSSLLSSASASPSATGSSNSSHASGSGSRSGSSSSSGSGSSSSSSSSSSAGAGINAVPLSAPQLGLLSLFSTFFLGGLSYIFV